MAKNQNGEGSLYFDNNRKQWVAEARWVDSEGKLKRKVWRDKRKTVVKTQMQTFQSTNLVFKKNLDIQNDILFSEYADYWLNIVLLPSLKPTSYAKRESIYRVHILPTIGKCLIQTVTEDDVQALISSMTQQSYSFSTIKKVYEFINGMYKHYRTRTHSTLDPCANVKLPRNDPGEMKYFSPDEVDRIIIEATSVNANGIPYHRLGSAIIVLLYTGLRVSEFLALTWDDVDFDSKVVRITKNAVQVKNKNAAQNEPKYQMLVQNSTKTKSGNRIIPLSQKALDAFADLKKITGDEQYVATSVNHNLLPPYQINKMFNKVLDNAGINKDGQRFGVHALRHTFATMLFRNGCDVKIVSELLGHSSVKITQDLYIHVLQEQKVKAIQNFDQYVD